MSRIGAIEGIQPRLNVVGRIRSGVKVPGRNKKGEDYTRPSSIDTLRFTSQMEDQIRAVAETYGGEPRPWEDPTAPGVQWEVITEANKIDILLPPDPLDGPVFEMWHAGGLQRRCDTRACEISTDGPDGPEMRLQAGCACEIEARAARPGADWSDMWDIPRQCKLKLRLTVILPDFELAGAWRIDTSSRGSAEKLPAMVGLVQQLEQHNSLPAAYLYLQKVHARGRSREYNEVQIGLKRSPDELAAGAAQPVAITAATPALEAADGGIVDADLDLDLRTKLDRSSWTQGALIKAVRTQFGELGSLADIENDPEGLDYAHQLLDGGDQ